MTTTAERLIPVFRSELPERNRVLVAIPAFNEERFIASVVHGTRLEGYECLVVDDGSTDRTVEIATAAGAVVESLEQNGGKSAAVRRAFEVALRRGVDWLVVMDGDWQHDPREIHDLLQPLWAGDADIVSGSRFLTTERRRIPAVRGMGLRAFNAMSNLASGGRLTDSQTGFHAFSRRAVEALTFRSNGFSVEVEVQFLARTHRMRHVEVPISVRYADPPKRNVFGQGAQVLDGLIRLVAHYRPLLFFGVPSLVMLIAGIGVGALIVDIYRQSRELAGGYAILAALLVILGTTGVFAGLILHVLRGVFLRLEHEIRQIARLVNQSRAQD